MPSSRRALTCRPSARRWVVDGLGELSAFYETGQAGGVAPDIERLLGRPARSFDEFAADHRDAFGGAAG